ncbi:MAG: UDP-N-acetylmuramoyl-L-alanine--D-glutamate ligase [Candidatus Caldatribacteriaceae bacterium]
MMGLGRTGLSVTRFLLRQGEKVSGCDDKLKKEDIPSWATSNPLFTFLSPKEVERVPPEVKECVVSPGVHPRHPVVKLFEGRGIPVISEIELASRYISFPLVGITGSCGKSTTVSLLGTIFKRAGYRTFVGGNLGTPLIESLEGEPPQIGVVELSSFQLERVYTTRFVVAAVTNLYPNHLDYHNSMEEYFKAKGRIFLNQHFEDWALFLFSRSPWQARWCRMARGKVLPLGVGVRLFEGLYAEKGAVWEGEIPPRRLVSFGGSPLWGTHNVENILVATAVAYVFGVDGAIVEEAIKAFRGLPHRLEWVGRWRGVDYYNDSKSTTPSSTRVAIEALPGPLIVILGGKAKLDDFSELVRALTPEKVRCVVLYGASRKVIEDFLPPWVKKYSVESLQEAVYTAWEEAKEGDKVLLSPACTSWDAYESFEVRGEHFRELVRTLGEGASSRSP